MKSLLYLLIHEPKYVSEEIFKINGQYLLPNSCNLEIIVFPVKIIVLEINKIDFVFQLIVTLIKLFFYW